MDGGGSTEKQNLQRFHNTLILVGKCPSLPKLLLRVLKKESTGLSFSYPPLSMKASSDRGQDVKQVLVPKLEKLAHG